MNLKTFTIISQFHVVYDNWLQVVSSSEVPIPKLWVKHGELKRDTFLIDLYDDMQLEQEKQFKDPELDN